MNFSRVIKQHKVQISLISVVAVLFGGVLLYAQAVRGFKFEAESGSINGQVERAADDLASGGEYLRFIEATTPPQTGVLWSEDFASAASMDRLLGQGGDGVSITNQPVSSSNGHNAMTFHADHDANCGAPTTYRTITGNNTWQNHNYWCPNAGGHFMTALNNSSYVSFGFTPRGENNRAKIFPPSANKICFDVNITGMGNRRWWDLVVVSEQTYLSNVFRTNVSGLPGGAITNEPTLIYFDPGHQMSGITVGQNAEYIFVDSEGSRHVASGSQWVYQNHEVRNRNITDKATRYKTCFKDNGNNTVSMIQDRPGGTTHTTVMTNQSFPKTNKVFIIQDKTYNADKAENPSRVENGYTWHWDSIVISAE